MKIEYHSWCLWCIHILWSHAAQQIPRCILRFPEWFMDRCIYPFPRLSWSVDSLGAWFQWWGLLAFTASRIRTISTSGRKRLRSTSGTSCAAQDAQPDGKAGPFFWGRRGDFPETMGIHGHPWASSHLTPNRPNHYPLIPLNIAYDSACDANICQLFINFPPPSSLMIWGSERQVFVSTSSWAIRISSRSCRLSRPFSRWTHVAGKFHFRPLLISILHTSLY